MSTAAKFSNNVEISGNIDISGSINLDGTLTVDGSFSLYGYHIPDPTGEYNKVLTISGDGYSWETVQSGSAGDEVINAAGQTFYEIITEQPRAFDVSLIDGASFANTFNTIDIAWNFDDLIPKDENNQQQILNITEDLNQRVLPCITHIYFDISSSQQPNTTLTNSSKFVVAVDANDNYNIDAPTTTEQTWSIGAADLKSTLTYKTLTLSNDNTDALLYKYTVRIWGVNESNGTEVNKLTYSNLQFLTSGIPATPTIHSVTPSGTDTATLDISLNVPDIDIVNPDTEYDSAGGIEIKDVDISCTETETLRSTVYNHENTFELSETVTSQSHAGGTDEDISVNVSFTQETSFNLGSKYEIQAKCINALNATDGSNNDGYTSYSTVFQMTDFIDIPTSDDENTDNPFNGTPSTVQPYGGNSVTQSIKLPGDTSDTSRSISLYLLDNLNGNAQIRPNRNSANSIVEITHPSKTKSDTIGYGKFIDNSENIISINCLLYFNGALDISLQQVNYHGWNISPTFTNFLYDSAITPFSTSSSHMYTQDQESNTRAQGFRLQAVYRTANNSLKIANLSSNSIIQPFDPNGCSEGYKIQYNLVRSDDYSTTNPTRTSGDFYVDDFTNYASPSYTTSSSSIIVTAISWVMGIPQVSTVDISFARNHININSEYKYFQSDGLVAEVNSIKANGTSGTSVYSGNNNDLKYLYLTYSDLNIDGSYNGSFDGSLNYSNITSSQTSNKVSSLVVSSTVHNLYTSEDYNETFNVVHHRDVTSISNYSTIFTSNSTNRIYELSSSHIGDLDTALNTVNSNLVQYSNHQTEIQSYTLPFINGKFTATTSNYPDICGLFEWDGKISGYSNSVYDSSYVGIDLDGNTGNYKCVVYEVDTQNGNIYYFDSSEKVEGINVSYIINLLFDTTIVDTFNNAINSQGLTFDDDDNDIYVFLTTYNSDAAVSRYQLGNLSIPFQSGANWFARAESALSSDAGENGLNTIIKSVTLASGMYVHNNGTKTVAVATDAGWGVTNGSSDDTIIPLTGTGTLSDFKLYFFVKIT